jgi:RNA polymerase sigma factor FliA
MPHGEPVARVNISELASPVLSEADLWREFLRTGSSQVRLQVINHYLPFARMLAAKIFGNRQGLDAPFEDYVHIAVIALIQSVDRFDPILGLCFKTYAQHRIKGMLLNELPKLSEQHAQVGMITRRRKERIAVLRGIDAAPQKSKRTTDLFDEMTDLAVGLSIGYMLEDSGMFRTEEQTTEVDGYETYMLLQMRKNLERLVEQLPEKEKLVIQHHYYFSMDMQTIGLCMNITKGRVSQLHKQGLCRIRELAKKEKLNLNL